MVIQRQAAAPYLSHYAEQIRWLRSVAAVLIKMGTNSKGERIRQPQQRQQKKEGVKVFHPKRIRKRTYISFYYKLRL
jgi:phage gp36-like protein